MDHLQKHRLLLSLLLPTMIFGLASCGQDHYDKRRDRSSFSLTSSPLRDSSNLRSFSEIEKLLATRLFDQPEPDFKLDRFLLKSGDATGEGAILEELSGGLVSLLGQNIGTGLRQDFVNASPNGVNMMLWYLVFEELASTLSQACEGTYAFNWSASIRRSLEDLCLGEAMDSAQLTLWGELIQYDAPESNSKYWIKKKEDLVIFSARERVEKTLVSLLFHPRFLLQL